MEKKRVIPIWGSIILLALCLAGIFGIAIILKEDQDVSTVIICALFICAIAMAILYCVLGYKKNAAKFFLVFSIILTLAVLTQVTRYYLNAEHSDLATGSEVIMEAPDGEVPEAPDGEVPDGEVPEAPEGEAPDGEVPEAPEGEAPDGEVPDGEVPDTPVLSVPLKNIAKIVLPVLIFGILFTLTIGKDLGKKKSYSLIGSAVVLSLMHYLIGFVQDQDGLNGLALFQVSGIEYTMFVLCVLYGVMIYAKYQDKTQRGTK